MMSGNSSCAKDTGVYGENPNSVYWCSVRLERLSEPRARPRAWTQCYCHMELFGERCKTRCLLRRRHVSGWSRRSKTVSKVSPWDWWGSGLFVTRGMRCRYVPSSVNWEMINRDLQRNSYLHRMFNPLATGQCPRTDSAGVSHVYAGQRVETNDLRRGGSTARTYSYQC